LKSGGINTAEVAAARWLMLLGLEGEGVHVNTSGGDVGVVLVRLDKVKVATKTGTETVHTVKLELSTNNRVATSVEDTNGVISTTSTIGVAEVGGTT